MSHLWIGRRIFNDMTAYAFYYNQMVYNSKDTTKTMEQPTHQMNMVRQHDYLGVDENPVAHDVAAMASYH
jgi:hypothetical protein